MQADYPHCPTQEFGSVEASDNAPDESWFVPCKAGADRIVAAFMLIMASPLLLVLCAIVRANSRGPAIFKQVRLGRGGRPFEIYKIRTMAHDCERLSGPQWAKTNDPRVTSVGRFLRRSHLDELPQLWNVVRGEMSLVGPRPERPEFVAELALDIPGYAGRMAVNPGITGLAQVQLPPDEDFDDVRRKLQCDLCYVRRMGPALDLRILVGTAMKMMGVSFETIRRLLDLPGGDQPGPRADGKSSPDPAALVQLQSA